MSRYLNDLAERFDDIEPDESVGSVDELGWFGLYNDELVITELDSMGFVDATQFESSADYNAAVERIVSLYDEFYGDTE
jgi:hypothetical protein